MKRNSLHKHYTTISDPFQYLTGLNDCEKVTRVELNLITEHLARLSVRSDSGIISHMKLEIKFQASAAAATRAAQILGLLYEPVAA
jgi:hypothetical protein